MRKTQRSFNSTLRPISKKQGVKIMAWSGIKKNRIAYLTDKYSYPICEYCGGKGMVDFKYHEEIAYLGGHHIDGDRSNNTDENCYICHNGCHTAITDNNIVVSQEDFPNRQLFV